MNKIEGEVTALTVLDQCMRMSNDHIWAFFETMPNLKEKDAFSVRVKLAGVKVDFYNTWHMENWNKSLADILQDLIAIQYEYEQRESSEVES